MSELIRVVAVVALLGVAAAIATPKGRLPLALRGLQRALGKTATETAGARVSGQRRLLAFLLIVAAVVLALL
jgi:hypothetical protein